MGATGEGQGAGEEQPVRVSKLLSEQGLCSRREADAFILQGLVLVDGVVVTELGCRARRSQSVQLTAQASAAQSESITILLNKPLGFVSHADDERKYTPAVSLITRGNYHHSGATPTAEDRERLRVMFPPSTTSTHAAAQLKGLAPAGRLDINSTGLLVLTQDGRVSKRIIDPSSQLRKEYLVRVQGAMKTDGLKLLQHGLSLDGKQLKPARVSWQNEQQLHFELQEGRKRQIRRMCELVGLTVLALKRVRIGRVSLGGLPLGKWRFLGKREGF